MKFGDKIKSYHKNMNHVLQITFAFASMGDKDYALKCIEKLRVEVKEGKHVDDANVLSYQIAFMDRVIYLIERPVINISLAVAVNQAAVEYCYSKGKFRPEWNQLQGKYIRVLREGSGPLYVFLVKEAFRNFVRGVKADTCCWHPDNGKDVNLLVLQGDFFTKLLYNEAPASSGNGYFVYAGKQPIIELFGFAEAPPKDLEYPSIVYGRIINKELVVLEFDILEKEVRVFEENFSYLNSVFC